MKNEKVCVELCTIVANIMIARLKRGLEPVTNMNVVKAYASAICKKIGAKEIVITTDLAYFKAKYSEHYSVDRNAIIFKGKAITKELKKAAGNCSANMLFEFSNAEIIKEAGVLEN